MPLPLSFPLPSPAAPDLRAGLDQARHRDRRVRHLRRGASQGRCIVHSTAAAGLLGPRRRGESPSVLARPGFHHPLPPNFSPARLRRASDRRSAFASPPGYVEHPRQTRHASQPMITFALPPSPGRGRRRTALPRASRPARPPQRPRPPRSAPISTSPLTPARLRTAVDRNSAQNRDLTWPCAAPLSGPLPRDDERPNHSRVATLSISTRCRAAPSTGWSFTVPP